MTIQALYHGEFEKVYQGREQFVDGLFSVGDKDFYLVVTESVTDVVSFEKMDDDSVQFEKHFSLSTSFSPEEGETLVSFAKTILQMKGEAEHQHFLKNQVEEENLYDRLRESSVAEEIIDKYGMDTWTEMLELAQDKFLYTNNLSIVSNIEEYLNSMGIEFKRDKGSTFKYALYLETVDNKKD